ncbi:MAG: DEAD/DEAH box helicase [candidate division KSB1 bacterium]|nr:DEAD/DEAH box helicase [candidate division KSB1 bacterium]
MGLFHPIIQLWFNERFREPTPPQMQGWPPISRGENTLILAPTGSGKTLAAFLVCIDDLLKKLLSNEPPMGVHTLYISPLKALNYDIERNLVSPLAGIQEKSRELKTTIPEIRVAVRTGDTPQQERELALRFPPHILITTPESLHLLLTSHRAQRILRSVKYVIVDEIHAISDNKRGTFLALLLERLQHIVMQPFVRIGLSATQQPLDEIGRFLVGNDLEYQNGVAILKPRQVTIVDAGMRKNLDLKIISPVEDFRELPENTISPEIYQKLLELIQKHRSTLIFVNNRAAAERVTAALNERAGFELVKAHHGSVSKEMRREIEEQLKQGKLTALVATATLELGIDMGAIDLVCQVESPKDVARALQRVGRAGHLYQMASKGRLIPKMRSDLLEMTVIAGAMLRADVSPIKIPKNCLDILAQQIIAMVAMKPWSVDQLYDLVRQAYPFQALPKSHFLSVVEMVSGRYPSEVFRDLKPRVSWDRVNRMLYALPGTQRAAILGGGAIPDTGQYGCYLEDGVTRLGELEEEFVFERRVGEVIALGSSQWRIKEITHDRVLVAPARDAMARMPFWRGEFMNRSAHLSRRYGQFCREMADRLEDPHCLKWLMENFPLDELAASNLYQYFKDQKQIAGVIPDDRTILIESFQDELGDPRIVILSPYGGRVHLPWKLAIIAQFKKRLNIAPESLHSDGGIVIRYPIEHVQRAIEIIKSVTPQNISDLVIAELADSAFFGIRFRHNANRAMLIPRPKPGKRSPLWLQRMRSRDLLEVAHQFPNFPIVVETYRESLQDFLARDELKELLTRIESGEVKFVIRAATTPSPFAATLLLDFMASYMYEYDEPKPSDTSDIAVEKDFIEELTSSEAVHLLLHQDAINEIEQRMQGRADGYRARTASELVDLLHRIGDLTEEEIEQRVAGDAKTLMQTLVAERRAFCVFIDGVHQNWRWIAPEDFPLYRSAFADPNAPVTSPRSFQKIYFKLGDDELESLPSDEILPAEIASQSRPQAEAQKLILERYVANHAGVPLADMVARYPIDRPMVEQWLEEQKAAGKYVALKIGESEDQLQWATSETVAQARRLTLRQQRHQVQPCDVTQYVQWLLRWQHRTPETKCFGLQGLLQLIEQFQGLRLPAELWETEIFAKRMEVYQPAWLDELCRQGEITWYGSSSSTSNKGDIAFAFRSDLSYFRYRFKDAIPQAKDNSAEELIEKLRSALQTQGACFVNDLSLATGLPPSACAAGLWELIWRGEVSNDSFAVIRADKPTYSLEQVIETTGIRLSYRHYRRHERYRPLPGAGRWWQLPAMMSPENVTGDQIEALINQILRRYGLICREIYDLERWPIPWRSIYEALVRLEWRGEIRRGYFVKGFSGLQFALPKAADALIYLTHRPSAEIEGDERPILINSCDPANLYGAASPLPVIHPRQPDWRLLRHPNNYLIIKAGLPIMAIESKGAQLTPLRELSSNDLETIIALLPQLLDDPAGWRRIRAIKVEFYDRQPVRTSEIAGLLKRLGCRDEYKMMILEKNY